MLKSLRPRGIADEAGVPPHILSNDTLAELAQRRPSTHEELLTVQGISRSRHSGSPLLEIVGQRGATGRKTETSRKVTRFEQRSNT